MIAIGYTTIILFGTFVYGCGSGNEMEIITESSDQIFIGESREAGRDNITPKTEDITDYKLMENNVDGEHVIIADGENIGVDHIKVVKSGEADGDEADFYGENSAVFATNGATVTLSDMDISTNGTHANAVFSYGENTIVDISYSTIETTGNCSGGLMTTGNGTMEARNLV